MLLTIELPEELLPEIYDYMNEGIESMANFKLAKRGISVKKKLQRAVLRSKGIKWKVNNLYSDEMLRNRVARVKSIMA